MPAKKEVKIKGKVVGERLVELCKNHDTIFQPDVYPNLTDMYLYASVY